MITAIKKKLKNTNNGLVKKFINLYKSIKQNPHYILNNIGIKIPKQNVLAPTPVFVDKSLYISLTSFPQRISFVYYTILSLMNQTEKVNGIYLYLADEQFPNKENDLPKKLLHLTTVGLTIKWTSDTRSYKKLLPILETNWNDVIITCDDDVFYPRDWLKNLLISYKAHTNEIHSSMITRLCKKNDCFYELSEEFIPDDTNRSSFFNKVLGAGGVLYPPDSLNKEVLNIGVAKRLAPTSDDIWFWGMAVLNRTKIRLVENGLKKHIYVPHSQDGEALTKINDTGDEKRPFYIHLNAVISEYNLSKILDTEIL